LPTGPDSTLLRDPGMAHLCPLAQTQARREPALDL